MPMSDLNLLQRLVARGSGGFVLAFHDISPERLEPLVDCLQPARPVPLAEIVARSKRRVSTSGLFAITVDDGVGETVRNLTRLFKVRSWPATFYLPVNSVETGVAMVFQWWRRCKPLLPRRRLDLNSGVLDLSPPGAIEELSKEMERRWHTQRLESYLPMTMELAETVLREQNMTREKLQPEAPVTWSEVEELSKDDFIRFESHGASHAAMSSLTDEELALEMKQSRDAVTEHTGRECRHLAYPFGSPQSIGARVAAIAERFYDSASTMSRGHVDAANLWLLPRIPLYPENSIAFAQLKVLISAAQLPVLSFGAIATQRGAAGKKS